MSESKGHRRNALAQESSPYLRQHATNPVNWLPWGEAAFARARAEDKPVFLSVGYSTCHWCHVMAHESFEDPRIAEVMNAHFINVKVDREERPDVDRMYMAFVQAATGGGGWPMSVWLTPDGRPFYAGTYFPPEDRWGRPGFLTVLEAIARLWREQRDRIEQQGSHALDVIRRVGQGAIGGEGGADALHASLIEQAWAALQARYDAERGGFGDAPKFPRPVVLHLLWRLAAAARDLGREKMGASAREMAARTLEAMVGGGIHDHIEGGFHRYSVDAGWHVPHFEKMLYDQAQIAMALVEGWLVTGRPRFRTAACEALEYVDRVLSAPEGGFFSAEDADSARPENPAEHGEGAFYVWTAAELRECLGEPRFRVFARHYGILEEGNAPEEADPHGEFAGRNILAETGSVAETAADLGMAADQASAVLAECRSLLRERRRQRPRPHRDEKVLVAWNGLMISALARAARAFGEHRWTERAVRAATFLREALWDDDAGEIAHGWTAGRRGGEGYAEDYACLIQGLLDLYETTLDRAWVDWAEQLQKTLERLFLNEQGNACYSSSGRDPLVPVRVVDDYDGAEPCGSSVTAMNLLRFGRLLGDSAQVERGERIMRGFFGRAERAVEALPYMLCVLVDWLRPARELLLVGEPGEGAFEALRRAASRVFLPGVSWAVWSASGGFPSWAEALEMPKGQAGAFALLCEAHTCGLPITQPERLQARLADIAGPEAASPV